MQTKQQIQQLLESEGIRPNKRLGQHFLIDLNLMRLLLNSANIDKNDIVLEVGCGTGSLTEALSEKAAAVIAVELDEQLAKITKKQLSEKPNVEVLQADILENKNTISHTVTDAIRQARKKYPGRFLLVSNLPYNVASPVMINLITGSGDISTIADCMYVTVQKEVALRMTAAPGGDDYGTLSIFLAATGDVKLTRTLKPTVFWPQPQVNSAMVSYIKSGEKISRINDMKLFGELVNLFMQHRRKMLRACTKFAQGQLAQIHDWQDIFARAFINQKNRPEELLPEDYIAIANLCREHLRTK